MGREIKVIPTEVIHALRQYDWPGNIRELENKIERALILTYGDTLQYGDWIPKSRNSSQIGKGDPTFLKMEEVEKEHIINILNKTNWKVSGEEGAAKILGLNANTLSSRIKKLGIKRS